MKKALIVVNLAVFLTFLCAVVNDGLSKRSKEQLVGKTGEEIVNADIAEQMKN